MQTTEGDEMLLKKIESRACRGNCMLPTGKKIRRHLPAPVRQLQMQAERRGRARKKHTCQAQSYQCSATSSIRGNIYKLRAKREKKGIDEKFITSIKIQW